MREHQPSLIRTGGMSSAREMRKIRRDREVQRLRLQRKIKSEVVKPDNRSWGENPDFDFKDEDRDWRLTIVACPVCGTDQPYMRTFQEEGKKRFQIYCRNNTIHGCQHRTPVLGSAKAAVNHWKLHAAMCR